MVLAGYCAVDIQYVDLGECLFNPRTAPNARGTAEQAGTAVEHNEIEIITNEAYGSSLLGTTVLSLSSMH